MDVRERIAEFRDGEERLHQRDYLGRGWLATYAAHAAVLVDELEERLDAEKELERLRDALRHVAQGVNGAGDHTDMYGLMETAQVALLGRDLDTGELVEGARPTHWLDAEMPQ